MRNSRKMMAPPARSMPSMASFLEDDDVLRTLRTAGAGVCDVRHAVRALGRKLPFRAPDAGVMVAHSGGETGPRPSGRTPGPVRRRGWPARRLSRVGGRRGDRAV